MKRLVDRDLSELETLFAESNRKDIHLRKASEIFNVPEKEVTPEQRRYAKTVNYAEMYGGQK